MKIISKQSIRDSGLTIEKNYKMTIFTPFCVHLQCAFEEGEFLYTVVDYIDGS